MKKFTTIIACIAFAIFGVGLAIHGNSSGEGPPSNAVYASAPMKYDIPYGTGVQPIIPLQGLGELQSPSYAETSAQANSDSILIDSLQQENQKLLLQVSSLEEQGQVNNAEQRGPPAPKSVVKVRTIYKTKTDTIIVHDTVQNPSYIVTQQPGEEKPGGCVSVYELKHIRDICPEQYPSEGNVNVHSDSAGE